MKVTCEICGKSFSAKRATAKFCSGACKMKANRNSDPTPVLEALVESPDKMSLPVEDILKEGYFPAQESVKGAPEAVLRRVRGKDTWVIPGQCKNGSCLNPNCPTS